MKDREDMGDKADRLHDERKDRILEQDAEIVEVYGQRFQTLEAIEEQLHAQYISNQEMYFPALAGNLRAQYIYMRVLLARQKNEIKNLKLQINSLTQF